MKRTFTLSLALLPLLAFTQVIWEDDFESYTPGAYIAENSGGTWTTWDGTPGTMQDAPASGTYAHSGGISAMFDSPGGNGPTDLVHLLGDQTTGLYVLRFWIFVEAGRGGYFSVLHKSPPAVPVAQAEWSFECYFHSDGSGRLVQDGDHGFTYVNALWNEVVLYVNLDADDAEFWVNGTSVLSWTWSTQSDGSPGTDQLGGIDFYAGAENGDAARFWVDDIKLEIPTSGINEPPGATLSVHPNPVQDELTVELAGPGSHTHMVLLDATGQEVLDRATRVAAADIFQFRMDPSGLPAGLYLLKVSENDRELIQRVVKQ